jgi:tripartite-type tricarboxylate transporter receptor subunit TctC
MRRAGPILSVALMILPALPAAAQDYPAKLVRTIVPFPAGGSTDVLARMASQKLTETLGQNFIVENRPGATGTIAGAFVAKSAADGYTLIMHSTSSYTAGFLYRKLSHDAASAFAPVIRCALSGLYIVSSATLPAKNIKELVALARQHIGGAARGKRHYDSHQPGRIVLRGCRQCRQIQ